MKNLIKKIAPKYLINTYRSLKFKRKIKNDFMYDYKRYIKNYASILNTKEGLQAFLIKEYHAIEKGLALRKPKPGFGELRISMLVDNLKLYINKYGADSTANITLKTLKEYLEFDNQFNDQENKVISKIESVLSEFNDTNSADLGGTKNVFKSDILSTLNFDFSAFVRSRHSTRDFTDVPVETDILLKAIDDARFTPSVCNRQAWKVYVVSCDNKELKDSFLNVQNGNKGFGEHISSLIVITGKISSFFEYERNQVFVDGGMFAMSVLYSLHSNGLGTCCLNTSYTAERNEEFKKVVQMDEDCVPIMFIAVGNLKDNYKVAISQRKSLDEIVSVL